MGDNNCISLSGGNYCITESETDAFRVESGSVLVFIVPLKGDGSIGRRSFIYEAQEGEFIPGFCYKDTEYCNWRFCFVAAEKAQMRKIENGATKVLKEKFAIKANIKNYKREGYQGGLVDTYRINIVTEDGFIRRSQKQRVSTSQDVSNLIRNAFKKNKVKTETESSDNPLYNCMAFLCKTNGMEIAPFEKIKAACGNDITAANIARVSHFAYREVILEDGWQTADAGPFVVFDCNEKPMVCLTKGTNHYALYDLEEETVVPVSKSVARSLSAKAFVIYRPLPNGKIGFKDIASYCMKSIRKADVALLLFLTVATALIGLLIPVLNQKMYDEYIPLGDESLLIQMGCFMASFMVANIMFAIAKNLVSFRISSRMGYDMQAAVYDRLFNLPENFFRKYESADLAQRVMGTATTVNTVAATIITSAIAIVYIIIYTCNMFAYSVKLTLIGLLMAVIYSLITYFVYARALKHKKKAVSLEGKTNSIMFHSCPEFPKFALPELKTGQYMSISSLMYSFVTIMPKAAELSSSAKCWA